MVSLRHNIAAESALTLQDTLLDLHSKLATVVRYYDQMLEERLSHTYGQHTIGGGYSPHPARPSSSIYPSISSNLTNGSSQAENFYTGNVAPSAPIDYGPGKTYDQAPPSRSSQGIYASGPSNVANYPSATQEQYGQGYPPQRTASMQSYPSTDSQQRSEPSYFQENPNPAYPSQSTPHQHQVPFNQPYPQAPVSPASEAASYYQDPSNRPEFQAHSMQPPNAGHAHQQQQPSPVMYHQTAPTQAPQHVSNPPSQIPPQHQQPSQPQQQPPPPQPQNYPPQEAYRPVPSTQSNYWQQQAAPSAYAQNTQASNVGYQSSAPFSGDAFPAAPTHQPQIKAVEESLIEL